MIDLLAAKRMCTPMRGVLYIGGGSDSTSTNTTKNVDGRVVGGDGSTNASVTGDHSSVIMTDHDAVKEAFSFAKAGIETAYKYAGESQAANGSILTGALTQAGKAQETFANAMENVKTSDVRVLIIAGLGVLALAAVMFATKKG